MPGVHPMHSACARMSPLAAAGVAHAPLLQLPCRPLQSCRQSWRGAQGVGRPGARAPKLQAKVARSKGKKGRSEQDVTMEFEDLMNCWDDVFTAYCQDSKRAALLERLAREGHEAQGRGFLFVRASLTRRGSGGGGGGQGKGSQPSSSKGFGAPRAAATAPAGEPLLTNPELLQQSWSAHYISATYLAQLGGLFDSGGAALPVVDSLLASNSGNATGSSSGSGGGGSSSGGNGGSNGASAEMLDELRRVMRGQDTTRLALLVGPEEGEYDGVVWEAEQGQSGERPHQPKAREFVVLLSARVDKRPATGADIVAAVKLPDGRLVLVTPGLDDEMAQMGWA